MANERAFDQFSGVDGPIPVSGGALQSSCPDAIPASADRSQVVSWKAADLLAFTANFDPSFSAKLARRGVTFESFFVSATTDVVDEVAAMNPDAVMGVIRSVVGKKGAVRILDGAIALAPDNLNGYREEGEAILNGLRAKLFLSEVQKPTLVQAEQQPSCWTKTRKSGLGRGPGSRRGQAGRNNGSGIGIRLANRS